MESASLKEALQQYADLIDEQKEVKCKIIDLENQLRQLQNFRCTDTVIYGRRGRKVIGISRVKGYDWDNYYLKEALLQKRQKSLRELDDKILAAITEVEEFINQLKDSRMRRILTYRYIDQLSYVQIAHKVGGKCSADSIRKEIDRFLKKI